MSARTRRAAHGLAAAALSFCACAWGQAHEHGAQAPGEPAQHEQHAPAAHDAHDAHAAASMRGFFGDYPMSREASGTAWQPEAAAMDMQHLQRGAWDLMYMGFANAVYTDAKTQGTLSAVQGTQGVRGDEDFFVESMGMVMAQRAARGGTLGLRGMLSLDPALIGDDGYPLLFQTGETMPDGITPLIDRQHPHDLFMELAVSFSRELGDDRSAFFYAGLPGEPALGPATFMHRASGMDNPEAPLGHHWFDSTHITFGVLTGGVVLGSTKLEASIFNGREPDEDRYDIETGTLDSWSVRASWNPSAYWSMQASFAALKEPEQHKPRIDIDRLTASVTHHRPLAMGYWQTTLAIGRNEKKPVGGATDAYLLESALKLRNDTTVFARLESVEKDELFLERSALSHTSFKVRKLGVGAVRDLRNLWRGRLGVGAVYNWHAIPNTLDLFYDDDPSTWLVFARLKV